MRGARYAREINFLSELATFNSPAEILRVFNLGLVQQITSTCCSQDRHQRPQLKPRQGSMCDSRVNELPEYDNRTSIPAS